TGKATHQVIGGPGGIPDDAFRRLELEAGIARAAPAVEGWGGLPARPQHTPRTLHLLGVDPFSEGPFRSYLGGAAGGARQQGAAIHPGALLTHPGACVLAAGTAREIGVRPGSSFIVRAEGVERRLLLAGTLAPEDASTRRGIADLLEMDIAPDQRFLGRVGRLGRIDLIVDDGAAGRRQLARAQSVLPPGVQILAA